MNIRAALLLALVMLTSEVYGQVPSSAPAQITQSGGKKVITRIRTRDGALRSWEISPERADRLAVWDPRTTSTPLSIGEALNAGTAWLKQQRPDIREFRLFSIGLSRLDASRWYYFLNFDGVAQTGELVSGGGNFTVTVLLDGSIVEPRVEQTP